MVQNKEQHNAKTKKLAHFKCKTKEIRTYEPKKSTRRRKLKEYID